MFNSSFATVTILLLSAAIHALRYYYSDLVLRYLKVFLLSLIIIII